MANEEREAQLYWHKCTKCDFKTEKLQNLKYHMESHTRTSLKIKCTFCSYSSNIAFHVSCHMKLHYYHLYTPNIAQSHSNYLQEFNHAIETLLLEVKEKQFETNSNGNRPPPLQLIKNSKDKGSSEVIFKCTLCNYSTDNPANEDLHKMAHRSDGSDKQFKCTLCNYTSNLKFVVIRHMNRDHQYTEPNNRIQENRNIESRPESYLQDKTVDLVFEPQAKQKNRLRVCSWATTAEPVNPPIQQQEPRRRKVEIKDEERLRRISQCREQIRMARFSMSKLRDRVKQQREIRLKIEKRKAHLLNSLKAIETRNKKLTDLSIENKKLEILRNHIRDTNKRKFESILKLRELQLNELKSKKQQLNELDVDEIVVIESNDEVIINCLKSHIKGMKNELTFLQEEERVLARDVELLNKSLNGVVNKVPDQMIAGLWLELEKVECGIKSSIREKTENMLNILIVSTEERIRDFLELKRRTCPTYVYDVHSSY